MQSYSAAHKTVISMVTEKETLVLENVKQDKQIVDKFI